MPVNFRHKLRSFVRRQPWLYSPLKLYRDPAARRKLCGDGDDLCVEGYPSSANSYLLNFILGAAVRPISVCSHCHSVANIKRARKRGLPVFVPIRHPTDAILSRITRFEVSPEEAAAEYVDFYGWVRDRLAADWLTVLTFEAVTERPGSVLAAVGAATGLEFRDDVGTVSEETDTFIRLWSQRYGRKDSLTVSLPAAARERRKEEVRDEVERAVEGTDAVELWRVVRRRAAV